MVVVATGHFATSDQKGPDGIAIRNYFPPSDGDMYAGSLSNDPKFLAFLESRLGPYPWPSYGTLELPSEVAESNRLMAGSAIETVGMPVFGPGSAGPSTLIHEMCHQWMGDCVSITNWEDDIWWVEGFATFAEYMRSEMNGGRAAYDELAKGLYERLSNGAWLHPGHLTVGSMFGAGAYQGGCMVFVALRAKLGDDLFFKTVRAFIDKNRYGNATAEDWIDVASKVSGTDLRPFIKAWLYGDHIPPFPTTGS
jgi:aminopeptidase N